MIRQTLFALILMLGVPVSASAAVTATTTHGATFDFFESQLSNDDLIAGLTATELEGDNGWHPVNPASFFGSDDPDGLPAFTDGITDGGVAGLLNDFPGAGNPTKLIQYDLAAPADIGAINVLTGNEDPDGRIFSTFRVLVSTDNGANFSPIGGFTAGLGANSEGYFESDPLGSINNASDGIFPDDSPARSTFVEVTDDTGVIASGVTNVQMFFFAVDNTGGQYRDPFDGVNTFTGVDDGLNAAIVSPILWEIDILAAAGGVDGDYNDSGLVEQGDLDQVLANWGAAFDTIPASWVNQRPTEGIVDQAELDVVLTEWGSSSAPDFRGSSVPEPGLVGGVALVLLHRRRVVRVPGG